MLAAMSLMPTTDQAHAGPSREVSAHEDVGAAVYAVIPPRPVPLHKKLLWRLVIAVLQTSLGRRWFAKRFNH